MPNNPITDILPASTDLSSLDGRNIQLFDSSGNDMALDGDTLKDALDKTSKADKVGTGHEDKVAAFDSNGNLKDSGVDVDDLAMRDAGAVEGNLAMLDEDGNPVDSGVPASKIGEIDEQVKVLRNHDGIAEGIADTLSAGTAQQFTFRQSGGDGVNYMRRIKGKTLVWNQLVPSSYINFTNSTTDAKTSPSNIVQWYSAYSIISYNSVSGALGYHNIIVTAPTNANTMAFKHSGSVANIDYISNGIVTVVEGHKYLLKYNQVSADPTTVGGLVVNGINITDLTLMFGAGNEPSTVEEFEALFPKPYYAYNHGALISNDAAAIKTVGFNKWDEEWEEGFINIQTGVPEPNPSVRTKNFIPVLPNTNYYCKIGYSGAGVWMFFYDSNKNIIEYHVPGTQQAYNASEVSNKIFGTPSNAAYIKFYCTDSYGTTYNHDICINLSDPAKNGTYEPYWKRVLPLGLDSFQVKDSQGNVITITGGLKSAGDVRDEIVGNKYIKRIGEVDLGSLVWNYYASDQVLSTPANAVPANSNNVTFNVCSKYEAAQTNWLNMQDKSISRTGYAGPNNVVVKDSSYTDGAAFKTAMSGVYMYYELATPVEYDLVDEIPNAILVDALGTEEAIFPEHQDGTPSAPFCCDSNYSISVKNLVSALASLSQAAGTNSTRMLISKSAPQVEPEQEETPEETKEENEVKANPESEPEPGDPIADLGEPGEITEEKR